MTGRLLYGLTRLWRMTPAAETRMVHMDYNGSRNDIRWRNTKPEDVAAVMAGISRDPYRWERSVQDLYRELVNQPLCVIPTPLASSTPKPKAPKYCICGEGEGFSDESMVECTLCKQWYHGICLNERIGNLADTSSWACPQCRGVSGNKFPENWKDSMPLRRRVRSDITPVPGCSNQLDHLAETIAPFRIDDMPVEQEFVMASACVDDFGAPESVSCCSDSESDYASIRCSKSRIGILDSYCENETTGEIRMNDSFDVGKPETCLGNTCDGRYSANLLLSIPRTPI
ncbi:unnamed protein product [Allacma fusca]|uniref:PHD-type domain-containing protein n=1 Tax=Allacma fusca TaxID=39272 RepID=A0A8J2KDT5_9HEXA|nr:unnamed protein product [Allacma fusca]